MQDERWLLPAGIEEILPPQAEVMERLRRNLLDLYESWGYQLVIPPFVAMWLSNLVAAAVGIFALWRTHRSGCTARRSIPRRLRRRASGSAQAEAGA